MCPLFLRGSSFGAIHHVPSRITDPPFQSISFHRRFIYLVRFLLLLPLVSSTVAASAACQQASHHSRLRALFASLSSTSRQRCTQREGKRRFRWTQTYQDFSVHGGTVLRRSWDGSLSGRISNEKRRILKTPIGCGSGKLLLRHSPSCSKKTRRLSTIDFFLTCLFTPRSDYLPP